MPMTDALQIALSNPGTPVDELATLIKQDGLNSRESNSLDTPLIFAARYNNLEAVLYLLESINKSNEKNTLINAQNKEHESALVCALKHNDNKKIALHLIESGIDLEHALDHDLPEAAKDFLHYFIDYGHLEKIPHPNPTELKRRADCEYEIGCLYQQELNDTESATKWLELAARDGHAKAMLNVAMQHEEAGNLIQAITWYQHSYFSADSSHPLEEIFSRLQHIAESHTDNKELIYKINMALGAIYATRGDITATMNHFLQAEKIAPELNLNNEQENLFFQACSLWAGPSATHHTTVMDCLDYSMRIRILMQANTDTARMLLMGIASSSPSIMTRLITCQLTQFNKLLAQDPLIQPEHQAYLEALSFLYGWNGKPRNILRGASLLKKIIESSTNLHPEDLFIAHQLIAFCYLQQEEERDLYIQEAFQHFNKAHAALGKTDVLSRKEIIATLIDGAFYGS